MKKVLLLLISITSSFNLIKAQVIPYGLSMDSVLTSDGYNEPVYYFKPLSYDSLSSHLIMAFHGQGGDGTSAIGDLTDIAERRHALIVAPNLIAAAGYTKMDTIGKDTVIFWSPEIYKQIYRHVLAREQRDSILTHLIGFSAGGMTVNRFMILRQVFPDSIPIQMAVSSNPMEYTFCTDFNMGACMPWPAGLGIPDLPLSVLPFLFYDAYFICNEHVFQFYNENYGVLIGTADIVGVTGGSGGCNNGQGNGRYARALNYYNFSMNDAPIRGTTLQWQYQEIAGVDHNQTLMYNTKTNPNDSSTIAETLLFDTPYHPVPSIATVARFIADTTIVEINDTVQFINSSINAASFHWDFGDGVTSALTNPSHAYLSSDTFTVRLVAYNVSGCESVLKKRKYIIVKNTTSFAEVTENNLNLNVYPNPVSDYLTIEVNSKTEKTLTLVLYNLLGEEQKQISFSESTKLDLKNVSPGIYFYKVLDGQTIVGVGKVIKL